MGWKLDRVAAFGVTSSPGRLRVQPRHGHVGALELVNVQVKNARAEGLRREDDPDLGQQEARQGVVLGRSHQTNVSGAVVAFLDVVAPPL
jgi:hypothetical protein